MLPTVMSLPRLRHDAELEFRTYIALPRGGAI